MKARSLKGPPLTLIKGGRADASGDIPQNRWRILRRWIEKQCPHSVKELKLLASHHPAFLHGGADDFYDQTLYGSVLIFKDKGYREASQWLANKIFKMKEEMEDTATFRPDQCMKNQN